MFTFEARILLSQLKKETITTYVNRVLRFVISRSWVRVPQMAPRPKPLKTLRFKGFSFLVSRPQIGQKSRKW